VLVLPVFDDATADDLPAIVAIFNQVVATSTAIYRDDPFSLQDRAAWLTERRTAGFPVLVARDGAGHAIAFGSYTFFRPTPLGYATTVEHTVMVDETARGAGLGTALVETLIAHATAADFHIMIASIDAENAGSIRMHERLGFTEVGRMPEVARKFGRWLELVVLQRRLGA
jgi:L-amino acid N-acyltransferase YncA